MTLLEMAEYKPKNRWDMLKIRGVGNQKFKNYGNEFLKIINRYNDEDIEQLEEQDAAYEYLEDSKIKKLKEILELKMDTNDLKEILYETLFKEKVENI